MSSPFPGMDPYLESQRNWTDFHHGLAYEIRTHLNSKINPGYYARAVTYTTYDVIEVSQPEPRSIYPDVGIWKSPGLSSLGGGVAVIDAPQAQGVIKIETELRLANVEVRTAGTDRLVTAIEVLSPINKRPGQEREKYLRKRRELLRSDVHLMEIDLLRSGQRSPFEAPLPVAAYYVTLCRENRRPYVDVWSIQLADRLPVVAVPLVSPDEDVALDLGAVVREVYERGGYDVSIDYRKAVPPPALDEHDTEWIDQLLTPYRGLEIGD